MKTMYQLVCEKLIFILTVFLVVTGPAGAKTLVVGSGLTYTTIQAAVDAAVSGDMITVEDGTYNENIKVEKSLTIKSENGNANAIIIAADSGDNAVYVSADNVTIEGFTVYGASTFGHVGILLANVNHCTVTNNRCGYEVGKENYYGLVFSVATNSIASNNVCNDNVDTGIIVDADDSQVFDNLCKNNNISGISISGNRNKVENNVCTKNGHGIRLLGSNGIVKHNSCNENVYSGLYCTNISNYTIYYNTCMSNQNGISLKESNSNLIILNDFDGSSSSNVVSATSVNSWESPLKIWYGYDRGTRNPPYVRSRMGNYYSDHGFSDSGEDGICDTAYVLPETEPGDDFPLYEATANYGQDVNCDWDAEITSSEDLLVLGAVTVVGSLNIEGKLTLGGI